MITIKEPDGKFPYRHFFYEDSKGWNCKYRIYSDISEVIEWLYQREHTGKNCFIVSAFRPEDSEEINNKNADILSENICSFGLEHIRIMSDSIVSAFFVLQTEDFSDEDFFRIAEELNGRKITFSGDAVREYFSELNGGINPEWLAVRKPGSVPQAVLMARNKEIF